MITAASASSHSRFGVRPKAAMGGAAVADEDCSTDVSKLHGRRCGCGGGCIHGRGERCLLEQACSAHRQLHCPVQRWVDACCSVGPTSEQTYSRWSDWVLHTRGEVLRRSVHPHGLVQVQDPFVQASSLHRRSQCDQVRSIAASICPLSGVAAWCPCASRAHESCTRGCGGGTCD